MARLVPVLLIHGFNGAPGDWTDGGFRQYLLGHGDLDAGLVRLFQYGAAADGTYNNRGDLRQIASRLAGAGLDDAEQMSCSVERLSADSVARGGPAQVTLIAHSLGGIISRYYLSRRTPDEFGTAYSGKVGRLITIGAPHRGADLARLARLAPRYSPIWFVIRVLERLGVAPALPAKAIKEWEASLDQQQLAARAALAPEAATPQNRVALTDSPIYQQIAPDSPVLAALNRAGTMPAHVRCHTFYGDIRVRLRLLSHQGGTALLDHTTSFGDLVVPTTSARAIPGARATPHAYVTEQRIDYTQGTFLLTRDGATPAPAGRSLAGRLPATSHCELLSNPAVHTGVLAALGPD